jgi:hypothetical protein
MIGLSRDLVLQSIELYYMLCWSTAQSQSAKRLSFFSSCTDVSLFLLHKEIQSRNIKFIRQSSKCIWHERYSYPLLHFKSAT